MHAHTIASDGVMTAQELIRYAIKKDLKGIAITDHDTIDSLSEARKTVKELPDFWLLPGIELSTEVGPTEVHILGYDIDETDSKLKTLIIQLKEARQDRAVKIIEKLNQLGIAITYDQVRKIAGQGIIGRLHIARALLELGTVQNAHEAFQNYLNRGAPAYVKRYKLTPQEAIKLIHEIGGVSVLAHPALMKRDELIDELIGHELKGIEIYYPSHNYLDRTRYLKIAEKHQLLITGGSDFHAPPVRRIRDSDLGECTMPIGTIRAYFTQHNQ